MEIFIIHSIHPSLDHRPGIVYNEDERNRKNLIYFSVYAGEQQNCMGKEIKVLCLTAKFEELRQFELEKPWKLFTKRGIHWQM